MSLTSCFKYVLELPTATLSDMLVSAVAEADGAGVALTRTWTDVAVGQYTATVDSRPADPQVSPPSLVLTNVNLGLIVHLFMELDVQINEIPNLDPIVYNVDFDLPGAFAKETNPNTRLVINFPTVTAGDLNLVVGGGDVTLTPELVEPMVHAMYAANPSLAHTLVTGINAPPPIGAMVDADIKIFDGDPPAPHITVQVNSPTQITLVMPGHFKLYGISQVYIDSDIEVRVVIQVQRTDGLIKPLLTGHVAQGDVTVTFTTATIYNVGAAFILEEQIATKLSAIDDSGLAQTLPTNAEIQALIESKLIEIASGLTVPMFTPAPPQGDQVDVTTFEPETVNAAALALKLEPLNDGTPCDTPDQFTNATGFAIAVSAVEANAMIQPIITSNINMGDRHLQGHDITVTSLSATLEDAGEHGQANGHIWIAGVAVVHVDCWSDPTINFSGPITLNPAMTTDGTLVFTAEAGQFAADDPCCAHVNPGDIANLIQGEQSTPVTLPVVTTGVGHLNLSATDAVISRAGIVIHGDLTITQQSVLDAQLKRAVYWFMEAAGGG